VSRSVPHFRRGRARREREGWPSCVREVRGVIPALRRPRQGRFIGELRRGRWNLSSDVKALSCRPLSPLPVAACWNSCAEARQIMRGTIKSSREKRNLNSLRSQTISRESRNRAHRELASSERNARNTRDLLSAAENVTWNNVYTGKLYRAREIEREANGCLLFEETLRRGV